MEFISILFPIFILFHVINPCNNWKYVTQNNFRRRYQDSPVIRERTDDVLRSIDRNSDRIYDLRRQNEDDRDSLSDRGYNDGGYSRDGYGRDGYGRDGYGRNGYGRDGYGREGYNRDGYDRRGYFRNEYARRYNENPLEIGPRFG